MDTFEVFHRTWYYYDENGIKHRGVGKLYLVRRVTSEKLAREICAYWNDNHEAGDLSDKAEYERD